MTTQMRTFRPEDHFRNLKGQQYLDTKWRVVWFREEHTEGYIRTEMIEHNPEEGLAVFKAQAGFFTPEGREVYATGYGDETRADFRDYLTKAETKSVGRALALLGYGTAQATELDDEAGAPADSPVDRPRARTTTVHNPPAGVKPARANLAVVADPVDVDALRALVTERLAADAEAASRLPKQPDDMNAEELAKTMAWLTRRARTASAS